MNKNIILLGEFSSGKSAFINLLLGVSVMPENLGATNLPVVKIWSGPQGFPGGLWLREAGQKNPVPVTSWAGIPKNWDEFEYAEITVPDHPVLNSGVILWDTPGINSTDPQHKQHLDKVLSESVPADSLYVFFIRSAVSKTSVDFISRLQEMTINIIVLQNIHEVKSESECRRLFSSNHSLLRREIGVTDAALLYIGDLYEDFIDLALLKQSGITGYDLFREWQKFRVDVKPLLTKYQDKIIGEQILDDLFNVKTKQPSKIKPTQKIESRGVPHTPAPQSTRIEHEPQNDLTKDMVFVECGIFMMGSNDGSKDEKPVHQVTLDDFYIDKFPVTVRQYKSYCKANNKNMPVAPSWGWQDDHPMVNVSWEDAGAYARWAGKRLLTEAEWEYAARGGNQSRGFKYAGSNIIDEVAWYEGNSGEMTHTVGQKKSNELGIYDMSGNVWEWCNDWFKKKYYSKSPNYNPLGPNSGAYRVLRGGSWNYDDYVCRVAFRDRITPDLRSYYFGFRCARTP